MEFLKQCLPELRFLYMHLKGKKKEIYLNNLSNRMVKCLSSVALNLLYSNVNGLLLTKVQKKKLLPFKASLEKVILVKSLNDKKNILRKKRGLVQAMLIVLFGVVSKYRIDD